MSHRSFHAGPTGPNPVAIAVIIDWPDGSTEPAILLRCDRGRALVVRQHDSVLAWEGLFRECNWNTDLTIEVPARWVRQREAVRS